MFLSHFSEYFFNVYSRYLGFGEQHVNKQENYCHAMFDLPVFVLNLNFRNEADCFFLTPNI